MSDAKTVYLVRHGQTPWTDAERVQGWAPVPLNEAGRAQIRETAAYLEDRLLADDSVRIESSDLRRAAESAEIIADQFGDGAGRRTREALRERDFGVLQGLEDSRYHRIKGKHTGEGMASMLEAPERGESWRTVETRVLESWAAIVDEMAGDESRIVVSHTGPMYCVLAHVAERRLETEMRETDLPEGSVFEITVTEGDAHLREVWAPGEP